MTQPGLIHYYYGDGKGKTTAALGLALRHFGHNRAVFIIQFLKDRPSGEVAFLAEHPAVTLRRGKVGQGRIAHLSESERIATRQMQDANLRQGIAAANNKDCSLLLLDEVSDAYRLEMLDAKLLFDFLHHKPEGLEVVMTGHQALPEFINIADYVTEMRKEKHPFDRGIAAREGIEY